MCLDELQAIVIDNGSDTIKAGFAGDDEPRAVFPNLVATDETGGTFVGDDARSDAYGGSPPMEHGLITNWDHMESVWRHTFYDQLLGAAPDENPVLLTEAPLNPAANREKMVEVMLEVFEVPGVYLAMAPVLSLIAAGEVTGVVYDCGHGASHVVPIYEGYAIPSGIQKSPIAGKELSRILLQLYSLQFNEDDLSSNAFYVSDIVREIKETHCFVAGDFNSEIEKAVGNGVEYQLPDGRKVTIGEERFRIPEVLFNPGLVGEPGPGVHHMIKDAIDSSHPEFQSMVSKITLAGGSTLFEGIGERLESEINSLTGDTVSVGRAKGNISAWIGGSILSSLSTFGDMCINSDEYNEFGPGIVSRNKRNL